MSGARWYVSVTGSKMYDCFEPAELLFVAAVGYAVVPPATSNRPSAMNAWPEQNASHGVGTDFSVPVAGSQIDWLNVPAAKLSRLLPDPAASSTLPVRSTATCTARTFDGVAVTLHDPSVAAAAGAATVAVRSPAARIAVVASAVATRAGGSGSAGATSRSPQPERPETSTQG